MKEKKNKDKKHKKKHKKEKRRRASSSSNSSEEWVEKSPEKQTEQNSAQPQQSTREDWMSMTGMIRTYTIEDVKSARKDKQKEKDVDKKHIDSYNPASSSRELNPYWKDGGAGLPGTQNKKSFMKPSSDNDFYRSHKVTETEGIEISRNDNGSNKGEKKERSKYDYEARYESKDDSDGENYRKKRRETYSKSHSFDQNKSYDSNVSNKFKKPCLDNDDFYRKRERSHPEGDVQNPDNDHQSDRDLANYRESANWKKKFKNKTKSNEAVANDIVMEDNQGFVMTNMEEYKTEPPPRKTNELNDSTTIEYLSDEKMNKLGAKIVKAEIMGDTELVKKLKAKLESAREYRKNNPEAGKVEEPENIMLMASNSKGDFRPLTRAKDSGDPRSKGGKKKAETHMAGERFQYFSNDDKYTLHEMFEQEKYSTNFDEDAQLAKITTKHKNPNDDLEDIFTEDISKTRNVAKDDEKNKQRAIKEHMRLEKSLEGCEFCVGSKNMLKHLMVSCGEKVYLSVPAKKSLVKGHCIITTVLHAPCTTAVDEEVWDEIMEYRKALTRMFNSQNEDVVFFETATKLNKYPHMIIHCVPMPRDVGDTAPIYFKKALLECETEWAVNKKVIELKGKGIRRGVPKGLPYFWVDFGMDPGFAHVIEDQRMFPSNFAEEIIGGILDLNHNLWKNPKKDYGDVQRKKVTEFVQIWKEFEIKE